MKILHLIDSLNAGGAERMAVAYANTLANEGVEACLWATRKEGVLKETLDNRVGYAYLNRKGPVGLVALWKAQKKIRKEGIQLVHAHSTSYFFASLLKLLCPHLKLIWHDHNGSRPESSDNHKMLQLCSRLFDTVLVVNKQLETWAQTHLKCRRVLYIRNFTAHNPQQETTTILKGKPGKRIVCVANLRKEKDHFNLLTAFEALKESRPEWTLHLIGKNWQDDYLKDLTALINKANEKEEHIFYYGSQRDIPAILAQSDIGVLASRSEGLPLILLEYGMAGLAVVATDVGDCRDVLQSFGKLVPQGNAVALTGALLDYTSNPQQRRNDAEAYQNHIRAHYTPSSVMPEVIAVYGQLLKK